MRANNKCSWLRLLGDLFSNVSGQSFPPLGPNFYSPRGNLGLPGALNEAFENTGIPDLFLVAVCPNLRAAPKRQRRRSLFQRRALTNIQTRTLAGCYQEISHQ